MRMQYNDSLVGVCEKHEQNRRNAIGHMQYAIGGRVHSLLQYSTRTYYCILHPACSALGGSAKQQIKCRNYMFNVKCSYEQQSTQSHRFVLVVCAVVEFV